MPSELRQRVVTGLLFAAALLVPIIVGRVPAMILLAALALFTSIEYLGLLAITGLSRTFALIFGMLVYASFVVYSLAPDGDETLRYIIFLSVLFSLYLIAAFILNWDALKLRFHLLYPLYTVFPFALLFLYAQWFGEYQPFLILTILGFIWANDTMAFFVGRSFGRTKLAPRVSPGKTWEGTIGGWLSCALVGLVFAKFTSDFLQWELVVFGLLVGVSGTFGDLVESQFKRHRKIKDSGSVLPGHGGFLDRFDSLLFCVPLIGLFLMIIKPH